jgi:3-phosphoshikimate 1-carboxyvinyltransferase
MSSATSAPISKFSGEYTPPGDKSISHRLAMLGALASGTSQFTHFLTAADCLSTLRALKDMGVSYQLEKAKDSLGADTDKLTVHGVGFSGLKKAKAPLDMGNSGTSMRLLLGILAGQAFDSTLIGDASLSKRPMKRVTEPLREMGAKISGVDDANFAPLTISGSQLHGIEWTNSIGSAQVKSAILMAGLYATRFTSVYEPVLTRDHTERLLKLFNATCDHRENKTSVRKTNMLRPVQFVVPGDFSSAAFFIAATLMVSGSDLKIVNVGLNPTRIGLFPILKRMGAFIQIEKLDNANEAVGNLRVKASQLKAVTLNKDEVPACIDEIPILMVLCALADGTSVLKGLSELRVKETDRIRSMVEGLKVMGAKIEEQGDECVIEGVSDLTGGTVKSYGDHRTAMSFMIAGLRAKKGIALDDVECITISYPSFQADLKRLSA